MAGKRVYLDHEVLKFIGENKNEWESVSEFLRATFQLHFSYKATKKTLVSEPKHGNPAKVVIPNMEVGQWIKLTRAEAVSSQTLRRAVKRCEGEYKVVWTGRLWEVGRIR